MSEVSPSSTQVRQAWFGRTESWFRRTAVTAVTAIAFVTLASGPALAQLRLDKPEILQVTPRVHVGVGYALGNMIVVTTDDGLVVVDTTENPIVAKQILTDFAAKQPAAAQKPVTHIIYTHFHGDHISGARALQSPGTKIIAQQLHMSEMEKFRLLISYNTRLSSIQFGSSLPADERGIGLAIDPRNYRAGYVPPDTLFDDKHEFEAGGVKFELYHTVGETQDHLMVWIPSERVLLPGDLYYPCFPMLASPMKPDRPALEWAASVDRFRTFHPEHLVASHGLPIKGEAQIETTLSNYARAIRHVHDQTVRRINQGMPLAQIRREVKLPDDLAGLPYLQPTYGSVAWSVNGIYRGYTGWYTMNPTQLNPGERSEQDAALVEAAGGTEKLHTSAAMAFAEGKLQLVLELTDVILGADPKHTTTHTLRADALEMLAEKAVNPVERNIYRGAAQEHRKLATGKVETPK